MRDERMDDGKVRRIRPKQSVAGERAGADPAAIRRRGRRSKSGVRVERKVQRLQMAMVIILCGWVLAVLGAGVYIERIKTEKESIYIEALRLERELSETTAALETVTKDRDEMVNARIPGLERLTYDESIQVGNLYVRNIIFTLAMKNDTPSYEYRVVFSNDGLSTVIPNLRIVIFNELGVQLGEARVPADSTNGAEVGFILDPGEVRTHSGTIEFFSAGTPKYFSLQIN